MASSQTDLKRLKVGKDGRCMCDCATPCPRGNTGMAERCTVAQLKEAGIDIRAYYEGVETFYVVVQNRHQRLKCRKTNGQHEWRDRTYGERSSGWKHICKHCGACAR